MTRTEQAAMDAALSGLARAIAKCPEGDVEDVLIRHMAQLDVYRDRALGGPLSRLAPRLAQLDESAFESVIAAATEE